MKISDPVIDLRTDWHPRIARFLEGNAGRAGRVAQDNPGHSARGPKRATERKTKARPASSPASFVWAFPFLPNEKVRGGGAAPTAHAQIQTLKLYLVRARAPRRYNKLIHITT